MPIPYEIERPIHELKDLQKVHLPISNYECPTKELLNKTDKERHMQAWQKDVTDTILHLSLPRLFIPP